MFSTLPKEAQSFMDWPWEKIAPFFTELHNRKLTPRSIHQWLLDWTQISDLLIEAHARRSLAVALDTNDQEAEARFNAYLNEIFPASQAANQNLKQKLLNSGLVPKGFEVPIKKMRAEAEIYRHENVALLAEEHKLTIRYNKLAGAQTVSWEGEELTLQQLRHIYEDPQREVRERAWRLASERQLADREEFNRLWSEFLVLRRRLAAQADLPDYRAYRWKQMLRLDYQPEDSLQFQKAILEAAVPAATRVYEKHRQQNGLQTLRPWDLDLDLYPVQFPPLPAYGNTDQLAERVQEIFNQLDNQLGEYFHILRAEGLLSLDNRKGKAPGAFCTGFPVQRKPFIFMNAVGLSGDIRTLLHESGHAFHNFERLQLPYTQQRTPGLEFAEVASMAMELLAGSMIPDSGLYSKEDARRFQKAHLEHILVFWPYMAVVDAFQHWVYTHADQAMKAENCDARWLELWQQYIPGVDWSRLDHEAMTGWHRKQHIFRYPFYYVEYGLAQLGAVQVWRNALHDPQKALHEYRTALGLGGTVSLPQLYTAAGARLAFDAETLGAAVELVEQMMQ